jgi:predicted nucleic acid-binding protein
MEYSRVMKRGPLGKDIVYHIFSKSIAGILLRAKLEGRIVSLKEKLTMLKETGFWIGAELEAVLLGEANES